MSPLKFLLTLLLPCLIFFVGCKTNATSENHIPTANSSNIPPRRHLTAEEVMEHNARVREANERGPDKVIKIETDPPGARVEVNDDYVGDAPIEISVPSMKNGGFAQNTVIRALPRYGGHYTQWKRFNGGKTFMGNDSIPKRIFFDMHLAPISQDININLNP